MRIKSSRWSSGSPLPRELYKTPVLSLIIAVVLFGVPCAAKKKLSTTATVLAVRQLELPRSFSFPGETSCHTSDPDQSGGFGTTTNCSSTPPKDISVSLYGYVVSVQLKDGRLVDLQCLPGRFWSCQAPKKGDSIQITFKGNSAKMEWIVERTTIKSLDQTTVKKDRLVQSYRILSVGNAEPPIQQ